MREVVIVDGVRTAIGTFGGSLRDAHPSDLGAVVIAEALRRAGVEPERVEDVVMGCVGQIAENAYIARTCAVKAGIPAERNAVSVNRLCSSGLEAVLTAARAIRAGDIDVAVAGGVLSITGLPFYLRPARPGQMGPGPGRRAGGPITRH
ncbi:MAG: acetyl-CoA C-acyltransferase, partial [Bacillota bacterium]